MFFSDTDLKVQIDDVYSYEGGGVNFRRLNSTPYLFIYITYAPFPREFRE